MKMMGENRPREFSQEPRADYSSPIDNYQFFSALKQPNFHLETQMKKQLKQRNQPRFNFR